MRWCFQRGLLQLQVPEKGACLWQGVVHDLRHCVPQPHGIRCGGVLFLHPGSLLVLAADSPLRVSAQRPLAAQAPQERVIRWVRRLLASLMYRCSMELIYHWAPNLSLSNTPHDEHSVLLMPDVGCNTMPDLLMWEVVHDKATSMAPSSLVWTNAQAYFESWLFTLLCNFTCIAFVLWGLVHFTCLK